MLVDIGITRNAVGFSPASLRHAGWLIRAGWLVALLAGACGGRASGDVLDDGIEPIDPATQAGTGGSSHSGKKGTVLEEPTSLGPCNPGVELASATSCDFVVKDLCYPTKLAACACACPRDSQSSTCASSFDVPSRVICY
jgi:hypothetical protein